MAMALREEIRARQRRKDCLNDVSLVRESDFLDHHLMNTNFSGTRVPGRAALTLAGIEVSKDIRGSSSNSGKTNGYPLFLVGVEARTYRARARVSTFVAPRKVERQIAALVVYQTWSSVSPARR